MANIIAQLPDKAEDAKTQANAAVSVPDLKIAVLELIDAVKDLQQRLYKLENKIGR